MQRPSRRLQKLKSICSISAWAFLTTSVALLFFAAWEQIYYWDYKEFLWGLTAGQVIVPAAIAGLAVAFGFFSLIWVRWWRGKSVKRFWSAFALIGTVVMAAGGGVVLHYAMPYMPISVYDAGPYLTWSAGQNTSTSITVCWRSAFMGPSEVRYGTSRTDLTLVATSADWGQYHHVPITGLQPNLTYYYQAGDFTVKEFRTPPVGVHNFTFCVFSDPRGNEGGTQRATTLINQPNLPKIIMEDLFTSGTPLAFSIITGDIVSRGVNYDSWQLWLQDITTYDFASNYSHVVAPGNHERHDDPTGRNFRHYYPYSQSQGAFNFSFDYGQVHVAIVDPLNQLFGQEGQGWWNMSVEQQAWLAADLASSTADFKVVGVHPTAYAFHQPTTWDGFNGYISTTLAPIVEANGVDVVFCGHYHMYETNQITNALWMTIGIGGNNAYGLGDSGYVQVDVNATQMLIRSRYTNGTWFDSHVIAASDN